MTLLLLALLACRTAPEVDPLAPLPDDPEAALASCEAQPFAELAVTCRVEAAARAAKQERIDLAEQACAGIDDPRWSEECHFRVGEELGRRGALGEALRHCARAGQYQRFCLTHTAWNAPPFPGTDPSEPELTGAALATLQSDVVGALQGTDEGFTQQAESAHAARFWFQTYLGSGRADPAAARSVDTPASRYGFALEAVRLLAPREGDVPPDVVDRVLAIWNGTAEAPTGAPVSPMHRHGRYHPPIHTSVDIQLKTLRTYGGGERLIAADPEADLVVATLEALYFRPETDAEVFVPFLEHPDAAVRWTAARMIRVTPSESLDHEALLREMASSVDPGIAAQAREGLSSREWTRFTGTPGRGGPPPGSAGPPPG